MRIERKRIPKEVLHWLILLCALICSYAPAQTISTIGGGYIPQKVAAFNTRLGSPSRITVGPNNEVYIVDASTKLVHRVTPQGLLSTVTGKYYEGFGGDGGKAIDATLDGPAAVAVDKVGNLFIADRDNHRIRRVAPDGTISTVVGNGAQGTAGDGGPATSASLMYPSTVATGRDGTLYVSDMSNRIRKIGTDGRISTIAGTGIEGYSDGGGLAIAANMTTARSIQVDGTGAIYFSEPGNNIVRRISPDGRISIVAGNRIRAFAGDGGLAIDASLALPQGIALAPDGTLYIADFDNKRIRKVGADGVISTFSGGRSLDASLLIGDGGPVSGGVIPYPYDVAIDSRGVIYIADLQTKVREVSLDNTIYTFAGGGFRGDWQDNIDALRASVHLPYATMVDSLGNIYFTHYDGLFRIGTDGKMYLVAQPLSPDPIYFASISAMTRSPSGELVWCEGSLHRCRKRTAAGNVVTIAGIGTSGFSGDGGPATSASLAYPKSVAYDASGNLYILDLFNYRIRKITPDGIIRTIAGTGLAEFNGDGPALQTNLYPWTLAVSAAGDIYVAGVGRIRRVSVSGFTSTVAGVGDIFGSNPISGASATSASFTIESGLALDADGKLYFSAGRRIYRLEQSGAFEAIAGNGMRGYGGDGGAAIEAKIGGVQSISLSTDGRALYYSDYSGGRIRKVQLAPPLASVGVDIEGAGKGALLLRSASGTLLVGRLASDNRFLFSNLTAPAPGQQALAVGDFDRNGKSDLLLRRIDQGAFGGVSFLKDVSPQNEKVLRTVGAGWQVQAVGDLDGDGYADIVWRYTASDPRDTGVSYVWFTGEAGVSQVRKRGGAPLTWKIAGVADINGDGAADMIYVSPDGNIRALVALPNRACANFGVAQIPSAYSIVKVADFSGRRRGDLLIHEAASGRVFVLQIQADGIRLPSTADTSNDPNAACAPGTDQVEYNYRELPRLDLGLSFFASGDFNGDGTIDIVWRHPSGQLQLWLMNRKGEVLTVIADAGVAPVGHEVIQPY